MDWKLVPVPVTDVDRAKAFYVDQVGLLADVDHQVTDAIAMGTGITEMAPGSRRGLLMVVENVAAARQHLLDRGVQASEIDVQPWGSLPPRT